MKPNWISGTWFLFLTLASLMDKVSPNFNLLMDREEVHKLLGLSSEIYLVREGVVNDYALNFIVNVPSHIDTLRFKWQSLTKKPVHYEMVIEFADFFALLLPTSNISNVGRLPTKLETFTITLPCSGRVTTEVPVIIRFAFNIKHNKHNLTEINVKRNKICLLKDQSSLPSLNKKGISSSSPVSNNNKKLLSSSSAVLAETPVQTSFLPVDPPQQPPLPSSPTTSPSMLLGGLLGACVVTASIVSVAFFLCLRRRLMKLDSSGGTSSSSGTSSGGSPTCLLRHNQPPDHHPHLHHTSWLSPSDLVQKGDKDMNTSNNNPFAKDVINPYDVSTGGTHNAFWNDIKSTTFGSSGAPRGADVSPYAYAHIVCPPHLPSQPPPKSSSSSYHGSNKFHYAQHPVAPTLIEWYSSSQGGSSEGHIYANHMYTFGGGGTGATGEDKEVIPASGVMRDNPNNSSTLGSLVHIDGFQCRKKAIKEKDVVERFL